MATTKKLRSRVLLADDHQLIIDSVRSALEDSGEFEVVGEAMNGSQVLALVKRTHPDVVVLDIRMPGMDGLVCLDQIKKRNPEIKVIVLSASSDQKLIENVLKRGASAYIVKSVNPDRPAVGDPPGDRRDRLHRDRAGRRLVRVRREGRRAHDPRARDPHRARAGQVERRDRERAVGRAADGQVPPDEHLPQAERREPHRSRALRVPAGPRREPAVRERQRVAASRERRSASP